jgi:NAD(P)-dependent dehydrogenase (short-subunit alcohol dehydrogenase family)
MKEFAGKVAVITGGASGIGRGIAEACVQAGVNVVLADVEEAALTQAGADLTALGGSVMCVKTDVSKRGDVEALAQQAFEAFGAVHLLFNNAGVAAGGPPWEATWNDWEWVVGVNLWGLIHGVKAFVPRMIAQDTECHIVNTASAAGLIAGGFSAPYSVTKHAAVALSESLYLTLQQRKAKVNVSVLCPGMVRTNISSVERNRPAELKNDPAPLSPEVEAGRAAFEALVATGMAPARVAEFVFAAIRTEQFYILTDAAWIDPIRLRTEKLVAMENPENPAPMIVRLLHAQKAQNA